MTGSTISPRRFRRRLAVLFVAVAALSGGFLAVTSYVLVREYRHRTFVDQASRRVDLAMLALPPSFDIRAGRLLEASRDRGDFETLVVTNGDARSSSAAVTLDAVPEALRSEISDTTRPRTASAEGVSYVVVARPSDDGRTRIYFFFSEADIIESVEQMRNVLALVWIATVGIAAVAGNAVARAALRPVRRAADAALATSHRLLGRVPVGADDEFDQWAQSFDAVVAALEAKIVELSNAAERERRFTSDVAHELRTPLTGLVSSAALLETNLDRLPPDAQRPAAFLVADIRRLQSLVVELLEMARLDVGSERVHLEPSELKLALDAALQPWAGRAHIRCDVEPGLEVVTDRARFKRIIANLVENAIQHGGANVAITARREGGLARVDVIDSGPGVPREDADRIFERFYKSDSSRSAHGSGLGLAIAAAQAKAVGGSLLLSNPGRPGAWFTLRLPCSTGDAPSIRESERHERVSVLEPEC
jgi:two-component system sensor histidine kinase MtrB